MRKRLVLVLVDLIVNRFWEWLGVWEAISALFGLAESVYHVSDWGWWVLTCLYAFLSVLFFRQGAGAKTQTRPHGAMESSRRTGIYQRLTLRRSDGQMYLSRWGIGHDRIGGVLLHRMDAPDPGLDVHNHPWPFVSIILKGGYMEDREICDRACSNAWWKETHGQNLAKRIERKWLSVSKMGLDECHSVVELRNGRSWSLVIKGPRKQGWGFFTPDGFVPEQDYDEEIGRRGLTYEPSRPSTTRP